MFVLNDFVRVLAGFDGDRCDFALEKPIRAGSFELVLTGEREGIAGIAADIELGGEVFGRLRHRVGSEFSGEGRVGERFSSGGVVDFTCAGESNRGFRQNEGRAGHAFDAARDEQIAIAQLHGTRRIQGR